MERDQILAQVVYGAGIAAYMNDGGVDLGPDSASAGADAQAIPTLGWLAYYNRTWNDQWTSSIGFSEHWQDTSAGQSGDAMKRIHWPTSARRNRLMVKEFEQDPQAEVWIYLDSQRSIHYQKNHEEIEIPFHSIL